jgi:hypothetical protein
MKIDWKKDISMPKLRRPSLPSRSSSSKPARRSLGGPELRMPKLVSDLYADLRDRHLLPLVGLLIVAIVAAPILLGNKGGEEEAAAITPAAVEGQTTDAGLTVVPAEVGLRDYKKRLGHRAAIDPFRGLPQSSRRVAEEASSGSASESSGSESASESGSATESSSSESTSESSSSGTEVVKTKVGGVTTETVVPEVSKEPKEKAPHGNPKSSATESSSGESSEASESSSEPTETTTPAPTSTHSEPAQPAESAAPAETTKTQETESVETSPSQAPATPQSNPIVGYTIDAEAGFVPHTTEKTELTPMTKLPNKQHPLVLFMGLSQNHKRALFLMTSNVTAYYGGHCAVDKASCQLVEVQAGKGITFAAGYGESRYKVHLKRIVPVRHFSK